MNEFLRLFGYFLDKHRTVDLKVDDSDIVLRGINANEITVLGPEGEQEDGSHIKVGAEVAYQPEDANELRAVITKVKTNYKMKKIQSQKKVVKPHYELTVRPQKVAPKKKSAKIGR